MVGIESDTDRRDGVTLVSVRVSNTRRTPQRVTLRSTLEGAIWSPGVGIVDTAGWEDGIWTGTIRPGRTRGVGFASPATPPEVPGLGPVELVGARRVSTDEVDPATVVASLEEWAPPSEVFAGDT